jgi:Abortive infection C-terminus
MSDLTFNEKFQLEKLLEMASGYVLDFNNRTLQEFVLDGTGKNIFDERYKNTGGSKANRLRAFWHKEPNQVTGKLLNALLDYCKHNKGLTDLVRECQGISLRLLQDSAVQDIDAIEPNADDKDFDTLAKSVRKSIENNEPEAGLDRLHTFVVKYVRVLCEKNGIETDREKPLHSLFGEYIKELRKLGLIESEMTERILKSSISILEAFNQVRNERSLAHDNPMLNYNESLLIFNNLASSIRFLSAIEGSMNRNENLCGDERR